MFRLMNAINAVGVGLMRLAEGDTPTPGSYSLNLDASKVTQGFFQVVADNILAILGLMGIMLGVRWVMKNFNQARKGRTS